MKTPLSYNEQEKMIANAVYESMERLSPDQNSDYKMTQYQFVYSVPLKALGDKELKKLSAKIGDSYDKETFASRTYVNLGIPLIKGGSYPLNMIEIIHVKDNLWITSLNFIFDDMAIYIGHQLNDYLNIKMELRNPEKTFI